LKGAGRAGVPTVAVRRRGLAELAAAIAEAEDRASPRRAACPHRPLTERRVTAHAIAEARSFRKPRSTGCIRGWTGVAASLAGPVILFALLFVVFQAVFAWATPFADALEGGGLADRRSGARPRCRRAACAI
jgi:ferrous iron transport protein B